VLHGSEDEHPRASGEGEAAAHTHDESHEVEPVSTGQADEADAAPDGTDHEGVGEGEAEGRSPHPNLHDVWLGLKEMARHLWDSLTEEAGVLNVYGRHVEEHPAVRWVTIVVGSAACAIVACCMLCCCIQPAIVHCLRLVGLKESPYKPFHDDLEDQRAARSRPFWWRTPEDEEAARREWLVYLKHVGDHQGLRRLGWRPHEDPERYFYGRQLGGVQRALGSRLAKECPDVLLDLPRLVIRLRKPIAFSHGEEGVRDPEAASATLKQVAQAIAMCNKELHRRSLDPLHICVDGYTADAEPAEEMRRVSAERARAVRRVLASKLAAFAPQADVHALLFHEGHGGSRSLRRGVELRVLTPTDARERTREREEASAERQRRSSLESGPSERSGSGTSTVESTGTAEEEERMRVWAHYYAQIGDMERARAFGFRDDQPESPTRRSLQAQEDRGSGLERWPARPRATIETGAQGDARAVRRSVDGGQPPAGTEA